MNAETPDRVADELARRADEARFEQAFAAASPDVQRWCRWYLAANPRSAQPHLDELAGALLALQAPAHPDPHPEGD
jgi:DNA-directed RNA polymerase specialized sigma24 family protein